MGYDTWISGLLTVTKDITESDADAVEALDYFANKKTAKTGDELDIGDSFRSQDEMMAKLTGFVTGTLQAQGDDSEDMWVAVYYPHGLQVIGADINYPGLEAYEKCQDGLACGTCLHEAACALGQKAPGFTPRTARSQPARAGKTAAQAGSGPS